jgi:hypothetical protein
MSSEPIRSTLYQAIYLKTASTNRAALSEDEKELAIFDERADEKSISYEDFLAQINIDGVL